MFWLILCILAALVLEESRPCPQWWTCGGRDDSEPMSEDNPYKDSGLRKRLRRSLAGEGRSTQPLKDAPRGGGTGDRTLLMDKTARAGQKSRKWQILPGMMKPLPRGRPPGHFA